MRGSGRERPDPLTALRARRGVAWLPGSPKSSQIIYGDGNLAENGSFGRNWLGKDGQPSSSATARQPGDSQTARQPDGGQAGIARGPEPAGARNRPGTGIGRVPRQD
ncbi:hypothetical protein GCM10009805_08890 [Leucobacter chromiireducens subsp. solipictus]